MSTSQPRRSAQQVTLTRKKGRLQSVKSVRRGAELDIESTTPSRSGLDNRPEVEVGRSIRGIEAERLYRFEDIGADRDDHSVHLGWMDSDPITDHGDMQMEVEPEESYDTHEWVAGEMLDRGTKRKRVRTSALNAWKAVRQSYLDEMLRLDGLATQADGTVKCSSCAETLLCNRDDASGKKLKVIRCRDCFTCTDMYCGTCCVQNHCNLPFHRIETWNGRFWEKETLYELGLVYALGHGGQPCDSIKSRTCLIIVLHTNGFHKVNIRFCGCNKDGNEFRRNQLLRMRLFPATLITPQTAFSFDALDLFSQQSTTGKISAFHFYHAMLQLTDNAEIEDWHKRYDELTHVVRWYKHLLMLKRAGRGHDPKGVEATQLGALALESPASPLPGKNLPEGWELNEKKFLYALYIALDANFRLKQKERGFHADETLGPGWAYFVDPVGFMKELERVASNPLPKEKSTCDSSFAALERANSRANQGYAVTGVVGVVDSRNGFLRPTGIADLHKGERYIYSDYVFLASTFRAYLLLIKLTYDIMCQWSINFPERIKGFPSFLTEFLGHTELHVGIPKFHLPAHGQKCWSLFSLNFLRWWGRTDGEAIERVWAATNPVATSVREMAPGARHDFLDDQWNAANFRKLVALGSTLLKKYEIAIEGRQRSSDTLQDLTESFEVDQIQEWKAMVEQWHRDPHNSPDPYQEWIQEETVADVRKELALEEGHQDFDSNQEVSQAGFLILGLELEESQRQLKADIAQGGKLTITKQAEISEKRLALRRRIMRWVLIQAHYMPRVGTWRETVLQTPSNASESGPIRDVHRTENHEDFDSNDIDSHGFADPEAESNSLTNNAGVVDTDAEKFDLFLPSGLPPTLQQSCSPSLVDKERRLRHAQLEAALRDLRRLLRIHAGVYLKRRQNVTGQKGGTRANALMSQFERKIAATVDKYQVVRDKLKAIDPEGEWQKRLLKLDPADAVAAHQDPKDVDDATKKASRQSEGKRQLSWIWKVPRSAAGSTGPELNSATEADSTGPVENSTKASAQEVSEAIRVEWAKAQARAERYSEEVELVVEEMRRVLVYNRWKANWWRSEALRRQGDCSAAVLNGCQAYAEKQAAMWEKLASRFSKLWRPTVKTTDDWPDVS